MTEPDLEAVVAEARRKATRLTVLSLVCGVLGIAGLLATDTITATLFFCVVALAVGLRGFLADRQAGRRGRLALAAAALGLASLGLWTFKLFSVVDDARQIRQPPPSTGP